MGPERHVFLKESASVRPRVCVQFNEVYSRRCLDCSLPQTPRTRSCLVAMSITFLRTSKLLRQTNAEEQQPFAHCASALECEDGVNPFCFRMCAFEEMQARY
jgi:hypothetical protein